VENQNGLIVDAEGLQANGTAERDAALLMLGETSRTKTVTVGGDKGFDTRGFVAECRHLQVTPHVRKTMRGRAAARFDARTTRHAGYKISQRKRKRIEECFGWLKTVAGLRKVRHRGVGKVAWISPSPARPTIWCACEIWRPQLRWCSRGRRVSAGKEAQGKPARKALFPLHQQHPR